MTRVFLAWSGDTGKAVAKALHNWLKLVVQALEPFMSEEDIKSGDHWSKEIASTLEKTRPGIVCLTPESAAAP